MAQGLKGGAAAAEIAFTAAQLAAGPAPVLHEAFVAALARSGQLAMALSALEDFVDSLPLPPRRHVGPLPGAFSAAADVGAEAELAAALAPAPAAATGEGSPSAEGQPPSSSIGGGSAGRHGRGSSAAAGRDPAGAAQAASEVAAAAEAAGDAGTARAVIDVLLQVWCPLAASRVTGVCMQMTCKPMSVEKCGR